MKRWVVSLLRRTNNLESCSLFCVLRSKSLGSTGSTCWDRKCRPCAAAAAAISLSPISTHFALAACLPTSSLRFASNSRLRKLTPDALDSLEGESAGGGLWPVKFAGMRGGHAEALPPFLCTFVGYHWHRCAPIYSACMVTAPYVPSLCLFGCLCFFVVGLVPFWARRGVFFSFAFCGVCWRF